jgi:hypothetical protein
VDGSALGHTCTQQRKRRHRPGGRTNVLKVDGKVVASKKMDRTVPLVLQWDETFDIGTDTGTPIDNKN